MRCMPRSCSCPTRGCRLWCRDEHVRAILGRHPHQVTVAIIVSVLAIGLAIGALVGWLATRPAVARLGAELDKERAVQQERLKTYETAEARFREAFRALSSEALRESSEQSVALAEVRFRESRTEAAGDVEARKKAIEDLLTPMQAAIERA